MFYLLSVPKASHCMQDKKFKDSEHWNTILLWGGGGTVTGGLKRSLLKYFLKC